MLTLYTYESQTHVICRRPKCNSWDDRQHTGHVTV